MAIDDFLPIQGNEKNNGMLVEENFKKVRMVLIFSKLKRIFCIFLQKYRLFFSMQGLNRKCFQFKRLLNKCIVNDVFCLESSRAEIGKTCCFG